MKTIITVLLAIMTIGLFALTTDEIVQKIDDNERVQSSHGTGSQTIETSGGETRTLEYEMFTKDMNDKQLTVYTAPARIKGDKILMLDDGDNIYFYTPKTGRDRHLAGHARKKKVQGSDFSYEDLSGGKIKDKYTYRLLGEEEIEGRPCYMLEMIPTPEGPSYSKLILWADKERFTSLRVDYYTEDQLEKRLTCEDVREIDGHWTAMKMTMTNLLEGGKTIMETTSIEFGVELDDAMFTRSYLKRK